MTRISGQLVDQKELALQALTWIVYAKRALSTFELQHALGVEVDAVEFSEDNIPDLHDTISACCGLVTIDKASGIVRLVHYTTQEFFEDQGRSYLPDAHAEGRRGLGFRVRARRTVSIHPRHEREGNEIAQW